MEEDRELNDWKTFQQLLEEGLTEHEGNARMEEDRKLCDYRERWSKFIQPGTEPEDLRDQVTQGEEEKWGKY